MEKKDKLLDHIESPSDYYLFSKKKYCPAYGVIVEGEVIRFNWQDAKHMSKDS
jgi:hypothetical protein